MERRTTSPDENRVTEDSRLKSRGGPIGFMAKNSIAANVVMLLLVLAGLSAARNLVQEVLPEFSLDRVQIVIPYPGATPGEVEESIVRRIEEQIRAVEGLRRIESTASEGLASVTAEFKVGTDIGRALNEVKAEVDRIPTFPAAAERPEVREITSRQSVLRLLVYGDVPERTLKELAYGIEEGLSSLPEVSLAETSGAPVRDLHRAAAATTPSPWPHSGRRRVRRAAEFAGTVRRQGIHGWRGNPRSYAGTELRPGGLRGHHRPHSV